MIDMFPLEPMDDQQIQWCQKTISSNAFYLLVGDALAGHKSLSVVRMADGELSLFRQTKELILNGKGREEVQQPGDEPDSWKDQFGIRGINASELNNRIYLAHSKCNYFAPSLSGIHSENFRTQTMFPATQMWKWVDNFFPNAWDDEMKINLYRKAGHVLFIHANRALADALQIRCKYALGVKVTYLELSSWHQSEAVIETAKLVDAPLVIFSGGPANKYIGPAIAVNGKVRKVTLDIGQAAEKWVLPHLKNYPQVVGRYVELI
jgi:hypothetical protein